MKKLNFLIKCRIALAKGKIIDHPKVEKLDKKIELQISDSKFNDFYVFENYEEFENYFKMYIDINKIDKNTLDKTIYVIGKKGHVVVFKGLCEKIISLEQERDEIMENVNEFYNSYTADKINEIHNKNKKTPYEKVEEWEKLDFCSPGDMASSASDRCKLFRNCHDCLMEFASHKEEYDELNFKLIDYDIPQKVLKK